MDQPTKWTNEKHFAFQIFAILALVANFAFIETSQDQISMECQI